MQLESEKPDFFLLDVNLPGMDGYTLCRRIKDNPALRNIPVTFVSSNDTIEERVTGYDAGGGTSSSSRSNLKSSCASCWWRRT